MSQTHGIDENTRSLDLDIKTNPELQKCMTSSYFCKELWLALTGVCWYKHRLVGATDEENVLFILSNPIEARTVELDAFQASSLISMIRNTTLGFSDSTMKWYYSNGNLPEMRNNPFYGYIGHIPEHPMSLLHDIGWEPVKTINWHIMNK